jgi:glycosyltransferase involved in cell wall biosynthesis
MKITIVGAAPPYRGGIAHLNALLFRSLSVSHTVDIISFRRQYPSMLYPGSSQREGGSGDEFRVPVRELIDSVNPFNWISVGRLIRREAPDLLIFRYWMPFFAPCFGTIARIARRSGTTRVLFLCDNVIPHEKRPGDTALTRYAFATGDSFIVQSASVERDLLSLFPGVRYERAAHPVYHAFGNAVPRDEARAALKIAQPNVLLFFGYVRKYKGLPLLIEALGSLRDSLGIHLLIVGEFFEGEEEIRRSIRERGLEDRVTIRADYVPSAEVKIYFSAADAVVLPYLSATQSGIAQIAVNFGTPMIATDVGGLAEVVRDGETGYVVPPGDPRALAGAIEKFFTGTGRAAMREAVAKDRELYSWERLVAAIERLAR